MHQGDEPVLQSIQLQDGVHFIFLFVFSVNCAVFGGRAPNVQNN